MIARLTALALVAVALSSLAAGCGQPQQRDASGRVVISDGTLDGTVLVGFGPVVGGQPTAYCPPDSPILRQADLDKILRSPVPVDFAAAGGIIDSEAAFTEYVNRILAIVSPGTTFAIMSREIATHAGVNFEATPWAAAGAPLGDYLATVWGDAVAFQLIDHGASRVLLARSRDWLNTRLAIAYYPVADLLPALRRQAASQPDFDPDVEDPGYRAVEQLRDLIERIVRSDEPWEDLGGRASIDFFESRGLMVVSQTPKGHLDVAQAMASLRGLRDAQPARQ